MRLFMTSELQMQFAVVTPFEVLKRTIGVMLYLMLALSFTLIRTVSAP